MTETGGGEIQVDFKSGECLQQTPDVYIHTCLGQVLHTDHNPIIDIGGDKYRMNNADSQLWKIKWGDRR